MEPMGDAAVPLESSPPCYKCQRPTAHRIRVADRDNGDRFDMFQCMICEAVTWSPPLPGR